MVKLRVAVWPSTPPSDPWTSECFINLPEKPCAKPGYELEPFLAIMTLLGWSYEWVVANDSGIILADGTATGALGMVQRGEADVAANVLRITEERMEIVEFSAPVQFLKQVYFLTMPYNFLPQQFVLRPFDRDAWLMIFLIATIFISLWAVCTLVLNKHSYSWQNALTRSVNRILITVSAMGSSRAFKRPSFISKCVNITLFARSFIFFAILYQTVMTGMLAVSLKEKAPFTTIKELVELIRQGKWHLIYPSPGQLPDCSGQNCGDLERALLKNPIKIVPFGEEFYDKLNYGKCVYFGEQLGEVAEHQFSLYRGKELLNGRGIVIRDDSLVAVPGGYFFPKKSKYRRKFDEKISTIFGGIETMVQSYEGMKPYPKADLELHAARLSLSLIHFYELSIITIGAYLACCVVFVLELIFYWKSSGGTIPYRKGFLLEICVLFGAYLGRIYRSVVYGSFSTV